MPDPKNDAEAASSREQIQIFIAFALVLVLMMTISLVRHPTHTTSQETTAVSTVTVHSDR